MQSSYLLEDPPNYIYNIQIDFAKEHYQKMFLNKSHTRQKYNKQDIHIFTWHNRTYYSISVSNT